MAKKTFNKPRQNGKGAPRKAAGGVKKRIFTNKNKAVQKAPKKGVTTATKVQDVRQKLILKKRSKVVDARDVLARIAKTQDARDKLNKMKTKPGIGAPVARNNNIKVIGHNILQKTDRNGKISLTTNKAKFPGGMNTPMRKEHGPLSSPKKTINKRQMGVSRMPQNIRQAVLHELDKADAYAQLALQHQRNFEPTTVYKWARPGLRTTASQLIGSLDNRARISAAKSSILQDFQNFPISKSVRPTTYVDVDLLDDEDMPMAPPARKQTITLQGSSRISNIHSRLDGNSVEPETHGILGNKPKTKVVVPAGHRIVVSNLQPSVTQDDVKELFEDIGQLLAARLVRPGVAEVIYKNLKDAQKAVETYHNRQLDGQPMKCMLVNKRPLNNPTALPLSKLESQGYVVTRFYD